MSKALWRHEMKFPKLRTFANNLKVQKKRSKTKIKRKIQFSDFKYL